MASRKKMVAVTSQWSLPLVFLILDKLLEPIDHVRFAAVCKEWHSLAKYYNHSTQRWRQLLPMLMIPKLEEANTSGRKEKQKRLLHSIPENKTYDDIQLPISHYSDTLITTRYCCSCGHGWLAKVEKFKCVQCSITLLYPYQKQVAIRLPLLKCLNRLEGDIKVILSADPTLNPDNYVVIAFFAEYKEFAFIRGGQKSWTRISVIDKGVYCSYEGVLDAIFYKDQAYIVVREMGKIVSLNAKNSSERKHKAKVECTTDYTYKKHKAKVECITDYTDKNCMRAYLVESTKGDILHVRKFSTEPYQMTTNSFYFKVYKLVFDDQTDRSIVKHVEIKNIGDEAIFVSDHSYSVSVLASSIFGCQPNSIYYIDNYFRKVPPGPCQMARVFNLEDGTTTQIYSHKYSKRERMAPAVWVTPSFNGLC